MAVELINDIQKTYRRIIPILLLAVASLNSTASTPEKFHLHVNQPIYLTGETIWFKVYNTNYNELQDHSGIVYVNLHDKHGELLVQQKLKLTEGTASGSLDIPLSYMEDYYYLTCFTRWNLQFEDTAVQCVRIPVFNPFEDASPSEVSYTPEHNDDSTLLGSAIRIQLDKDSYSRREQVKAIISSDVDGISRLSISVHALGQLLPRPILVNDINYELTDESDKETSLSIEGIVTDPATNEVIISNVISLYKVGTNEFIKANSLTGAIQVDLEEFTGNNRFQVFNLNPYQQLAPTFTQLKVGEQLRGLQSERLKRDPEIDRYIKDAIINQKITEIFSTNGLDSVQMKEFELINLKPDKVYQMEKYQNIKTFEEFLREVVAMARLKKENDHITVRLKNRETSRDFMEKPWYLVDGYLTKDEAAVLDIPFKYLKRVELFNTNKSIIEQLEPVMIRSGLIAVYTHNNHLAQRFQAQENIIEVAGFATSKEFENAVARDPNIRDNPCFKPSLYWNADVSLSSRATVTFHTSDLMDEYVIQVEGIDENGQIIQASKSLTVGY